MTPQISIIVPIYNSSNYLEKCLKSLQSQTFKGFEVLLINDGSTDNSLTICNAFCKLDNRFKIFTQTNSGVSAARNTGLEKCSGKYICFVDSDDWVEKDYCKIMFENFTKDNIDLIMCGFKTYFSSNNYKADTINERSLITHNDIIKHIRDYNSNASNIFGNSVCGKLFKRDIIVDNYIVFNRNVRVGEDLLFVLEYQKHIYLAVCIPEKLYNVNRSYNESITSSYVPNYWEDLLLVKKKTFEINSDITTYTDEYKYYQYLRVATKAICEEGKLNNGKKITLRYQSIKDLCNKKEVKYYCGNYKIPHDNDKFYQLIMKLIKLNMPLLIFALITMVYKFKLLKD